MNNSWRATARKAIHRVVISWALLMANVFAVAQTLPYYDTAQFTPLWLDSGDDAIAQVHQVGEFSLTNQHGDTVDSQTTEGKIYVTSFFFSTCPGICPTLKSKLSRVQEAYADNESVLILSHSIRPTSDTVQILKDYASANNITSANWHLLTGERDSIYQLAKQSYFASEDLGEQASLEEFLHTENLLLIDQDRHIRGVYNGLSNASVSYLLQDINVLLGEQSAVVASSAD